MAEIGQLIRLAEEDLEREQQRKAAERDEQPPFVEQIDEWNRRRLPPSVRTFDPDTVDDRPSTFGAIERITDKGMQQALRDQLLAGGTVPPDEDDAEDPPELKRVSGF